MELFRIKPEDLWANIDVFTRQLEAKRGHKIAAAQVSALGNLVEAGEPDGAGAPGNRLNVSHGYGYGYGYGGSRGYPGGPTIIARPRVIGIGKFAQISRKVSLTAKVARAFDHSNSNSNSNSVRTSAKSVGSGRGDDDDDESASASVSSNDRLPIANGFQLQRAFSAK